MFLVQLGNGWVQDRVVSLKKGWVKVNISFTKRRGILHSIFSINLTKSTTSNLTLDLT